MHIGNRKPEYKCEKSFIDDWKTDQTKDEQKEEYAGQVKAQMVKILTIFHIEGKEDLGPYRILLRCWIQCALDPLCFKRQWC